MNIESVNWWWYQCSKKRAFKLNQYIYWFLWFLVLKYDMLGIRVIGNLVLNCIFSLLVFSLTSESDMTFSQLYSAHAYFFLGYANARPLLTIIQNDNDYSLLHTYRYQWHTYTWNEYDTPIITYGNLVHTRFMNIITQICTSNTTHITMAVRRRF